MSFDGYDSYIIGSLIFLYGIGNYDGLGSKRQVELMRSCIELGVWEDNIYVLDHASLQDGPDTKWDRNTISSILSDFCIQHGIELVSVFSSRCFT